jgi:hypothetical protein
LAWSLVPDAVRPGHAEHRPALHPSLTGTRISSARHDANSASKTRVSALLAPPSFRGTAATYRSGIGGRTTGSPSSAIVSRGGGAICTGGGGAAAAATGAGEYEGE